MWSSILWLSFMKRFQLKVSKFQKQIFLFSFEPKNERLFLISALRIQNGSNKKNNAFIKPLNCVFIFLIWLILEARAEFKK